MRLVDYDQFGTGPDELVSVTLGLDEVERDHKVVAHLEQRPSSEKVPFQPGGGGSQYQLGLDVELGPQFVLPLFRQVRRAEDRQFPGISAFQQFPGDQTGLDRLSHAHVVGDQHPHRIETQCHQEGHQLVGPGLDGDAPCRAERPGAGSEAQPQGIAEQASRLSIAQVGSRVGHGEPGRFHLLDLGEYPGGFVVAASQGADHQQLGIGIAQHHPVAASGGHQASRREDHSIPPWWPAPKTSWFSVTILSQSSLCPKRMVR